MDFIPPLFSIFIVGQVLTFNLQENSWGYPQKVCNVLGQYLETCPTIKIFYNKRIRRIFNDTVLGFPFSFKPN